MAVLNFFGGEADIYLTASISEKLYPEIQESQLVKFDTGAHFIQEDEPEMISTYILNFISHTDEI